MIKLSDYVFKYLKEYGIDDVFMLAGGGCMHLTESVGNSGINYIPCLHEQAATIGAIGYSQYLNKMGVVLVTTGPGGTNTITGVAGAWADSMPLLIISGQVKSADIAGDSGIRMLGFQEVAVTDIVKPITKYAVTVMDASKIKMYLDKAVYLANEGRKGPVWLDIPLDIQGTMIDESQLEGYEPDVASKEEMLEKKAQEAAQLLRTAKRPVILAGYGIKQSGCFDIFMKLIEDLDIPVLTTWKGIDFLYDGHPLYCGRPGSTGQRGANFAIQNCDLFIALGARLDYGQIGYEHQYFAREARKVVVEVDDSEFKKFGFTVDVPVVGDVGVFIRKLVDLKIGRTQCDEWKAKCKEWNSRYPVIQKKFFEQSERISTYAFVDVLTDMVTEGYVHAPCCSGVGVEIFLQAMHIHKGVEVVLNCPGLGSMGFGVPNALGVAVASGKRTVCVTGEGGFQLNIQELETIHRLKLPVKFFVLNNEGYGSIMNMQNNYFKGHFVGANKESGLTFPEIERIAYAYKFDYYRIEKTADLEHIIGQVLDSDRQAICEVLVNPDDKAEPKVSSAIGKDGRMHSMPLEDLWPFMPREEFEENMIIDVVDP